MTRARMFQTIIGMIMIMVAFLMFPMVLDGASSVLDHANLGNMTGLDDIVGIAPTIIFLGLIAGGGVLGFKGLKG